MKSALEMRNEKTQRIQDLGKPKNLDNVITRTENGHIKAVPFKLTSQKSVSPKTRTSNKLDFTSKSSNHMFTKKSPKTKSTLS